MRQKKLISRLFLTLSIPSLVFSQPSNDYDRWLLTPEIKKGFDFALSAAKLTYQDFTLRPDYWEIDSARMPIVNELMASPLQSTSYFLKKAEEIATQKSIADLTLLLISGAYPKIPPEDLPLNPQQPVWNRDVFKPNFLQKIENNEALEKIVQQLARVLDNLRPANVFPYAPSELNFIQQKFPRVILEDTAEETLSVDAQDSIQKVEEGLTRQFIPLAAKFNPAKISMEFSSRQWTFEEIVEQLKKLSIDKRINNNSLILDNMTDFGRIVVGGPGPNHYNGDYALIIDLGGDDTYELTRRPNFENQIIIDLGGNDKYFALEDYALASGYFGYSVLIDVAGDDLYYGKNFSLGCGFFGCGLLWDQAGNDTYIGDTFTEGAGGFGIGILKDDGGNDHYQAALYGQGFGFVRGVGALLDANGTDNYFAGGKYKELLGLAGEIRYQSMSQGCAYGLRPYLSGGMGFLFDYDGDDSYSVDMNGQGSSYWWGLGALVDFKGNDRYIAHQYAQGAGIHMGLGVLVDSSGNDFYFSKGASQGEGHDWGAGMLFDLSGNDNYVATDGSQAFGNVNGIGIIVDGAGDDGYYVKDKSNTQAAGNPRREYGSIGLFLDCGGKDHYDGNGGDNRFWRPIAPNNMWGIGVDGNFGSLDSAQVKK